MFREFGKGGFEKGGFGWDKPFDNAVKAVLELFSGEGRSDAPALTFQACRSPGERPFRDGRKGRFSFPGFILPDTHTNHWA